MIKNCFSICLCVFTIYANQIYAQANTALSNLTTPAINRALVPGSVYSILDLGTSLYGWRTIYMGNTDSISSYLMYYTGQKFLHTSGGSTGLNSEGLYLGEYAGNNAGSANNGCVGIGYSALKSMSAGSHNTAVGWRSMYNLSGTGGMNPGDKNTMIGSRAGQRLSTGSGNTGIGHNVFYQGGGGETNSYIAGTGNTGVGAAVLVDAVDYGVLGLLGSGSYNTVLGYGSGIKITTGNNNLILGDNAGSDVTLGIIGGNSNILIGSGINLPAGTSSVNSNLNIGNTLYGDLSNDFIGIGSSALSSMLNVGANEEFQISSSGKVVKYNNENTASAGNGVPAELAIVDLAAQNATITPADLISSANVSGGFYRITFEGIITTAGSSSSSLSIQVLYTDTEPTPSGTAVVLPKNTIEDITKTTSNTAFQSTFTGTFLLKAKAGTAIKYKINYTSNTSGSMVYSIRIVAEKL